MKKIVLVLPDLITGGAQKVMLNLAKGFADRHYQVDLVTLSGKGDLFSEVPDNVNLVILNQCKHCSLWITSIFNVLKFAKRIRNENYDTILSTLTGTNLFITLVILLWRIDIPIFIREASTSHNIKSSFKKWLVRKLYPKTNCIIAVTNEIAREMSELTGINKNAITVIHNPVNLPAIQQQSKDTVKHRWIDNKNQPIIITIGRLIPAKDYGTLIQAMALLNKDTAVRLIVIGDGPERQHITSVINEQGLDNQINLLGHQLNPYAYLIHADALVVSSRYEGFVNVLLEAMALGIPVVSTNCPSGPSEILDNGKYGELVPVGDSTALANAIRKTIENPIEKKILLERTKAFSLNHIVAQYIDLFQVVNNSRERLKK